MAIHKIKPRRLVGTEIRSWLGVPLLFSVILSGCVGQLPEDGADLEGDTEYALAAEIRSESSLRVFSSDADRIVTQAVWNDDGGRPTIQLRGLQQGFNQPIIISNANTREVIRAFNSSDINQLSTFDDDRRRVIPVSFASSGLGGVGINNGFANIPCSIRIQTNNGYQIVPVANVPQNCVGLQNSALGLLTVTSAGWDVNRLRLVVRGTGALPQQIVTVLDGATGQLIGTDQANALGVWSVKVQNLFTVPCVVNVTSNNQYAQARVSGAPQLCGSLIGNIPGGIPGYIPPGTLPVAVAPSPILSPVGGTNYSVFNQAPESIIQTPVADLIVPPGTPVTFSGTGFDPDGNVPLTYEWRFDGMNRIRNGQTETFVFSQPGVYRVSLSVRDSFGMIDPTPATRLVIVQAYSAVNAPVGGVFQNQAPVGTIVSPQQTNTTIAAGQAVYFAATGFSPAGDLLTYYWNFGGGTQSISLQNPGNVIFAYPGTYVVTLTVADSRGNIDPTPEYRTITVTGGTGFITPPYQTYNQAPVGQIISPAADVTNLPVGSTVNFAATGYDPDNNVPLQYYWSFGSAAQSSTVQNPGPVTFNQPGVYYVTLTVSDALGLTDPTPKTRIISVGTSSGNIPVFSNQPPSGTITAPATDVQVFAGQPVRFESIGIDPENNNPLIYYWDFGGALPNMLIQNPGDIIFSQPGSYRVRLTVQDSQGLQDPTPAIRTITVLPTGGFGGGSGGQAPNGVILSPQTDITVSVGQAVNFSAIGQDNDGTVIAYNWDFGGVAQASQSQTPPPVVFSQAGTYFVSLTVRDNTGLSDPTPDTRVITVIGSGALGNQAPNAGIISPATDLTINQGESLNFVGIGIDPDSTSSTGALTYTWNFGGASTTFPANVNTPSPGPVTFSQPGVFTVTLSVRDPQGLADPTPAQRTITVLDRTGANTAPIPQIVSPQTITSVALNQSLNFQGSANDPNGDVVSYYWDFDGAASDSTLQNPGAVIFSKPGTYTVRLFATDARGMRSLQPAVTTVTVAGVSPLSPQAPTATMLSPSADQTINLGATISFNATAFDIDNNTPLSYRWSFDGLMPGSSAQIPGNVTFNRVGTFRVTLTVRDSTGAASTPVVRLINVVNQYSPFTGAIPGSTSGTTTPYYPFPTTGSGIGAPEGYITMPLADITVVAGRQVSFQGSGIDPTSAAAVQYQWDFGGGSSSNGNNVPNPIVTFITPGTYTVRLTVRNSAGQIDSTPATRTITVIGTATGGTVGGTFPSTGTQVTPEGFIRMPAVDITVRAGTSVTFTGEGVAPAGSTTALTYSWNFGTTGVSPTTGSGASATATFTTPGQYFVTLTVSSNGVSDPTPDTVIITVVP